MNIINYKGLTNSERITLSLRRIYEGYGYSHFKMSKFEEYDLYASFKDFLLSDGIITFTDRGGRLLALKPDVTLSIIKNSDAKISGTEKYYYNENVYRTSVSTGSYAELLQTGVECIGEITPYDTAETVIMAKKSLECISPDYVLDVAHMGVIKELLEKITLDEEDKQALIKCIGEKSAHGISLIADRCGVPEEYKNALTSLVSIEGDIGSAAEELKERIPLLSDSRAVNELIELADALSSTGLDGKVRLDFSVVHGRTYYNGIVFCGFVKGVPERVLSGGRYDLLMERMGRKSGGIGFAVYTDTLSRLYNKNEREITDVLILTDGKEDVKILTKETEKLINEGKTFLVSKDIPERRSFGKIMKLTDGELREAEI